MVLEKLTGSWIEKYNAYLSSKDNTLLFQTYSYQELVCETINAELETVIAVDEKGFIKGALPLASKSGTCGKVYNSFPFYGSNGGFIYDNAEALAVLNDHYNTICSQKETCLGMISENPLDKLTNVVADITDPRMCQFTKLNYANAEEGLMESFHFKTRNVVRKSQKQGMEVIESNEDIDFLYDTHFENMTAIGGKPKPKLFFTNIKKYFKPGTDFKIFIAKKDGVKISALLLFYFNGIVEYYTPVIKTEFRNLQPNSLLIFHAMKEASERGFKLWNWGGTWKSQEDLYRFKSRWGAYDVDYNYYIKLNNKKILELTAAEVLEQYPFFFTVPFNLLSVAK